jgi:hypothetical protein
LERPRIWDLEHEINARRIFISPVQKTAARELVEYILDLVTVQG